MRYIVIFVKLVKTSKNASSHYKTFYFTNLWRCLRLFTGRGFEPDYAFDMGFLDPNFDKKNLSSYLSKKALKNIQRQINPVLWESLLEDKSLFYKYCTAANIPIPKLFAVFFQTAAGWSYKGNTLKSREDWVKFFERDIPPEFLIKPARGALGREITIFHRSQKTFNEADGKSYSAEDIYNSMLSNSLYNYDCYVIQERLRNHPELVQFTESEALQTIRMITFIDERSQPKILLASQKFAIGSNKIDNQKRGLLGNIRAEVSENGVLHPAITTVPKKPGVKQIVNHPQTGLSFETFKVPFWKETCQLVENVSLKFLPFRLVGWDVAITIDGPYIIEGNMWCDPPSPHKTEKIIEAISEDKNPRQNFF